VATGTAKQLVQLKTKFLWVTPASGSMLLACGTCCSSAWQVVYGAPTYRESEGREEAVAAEAAAAAAAEAAAAAWHSASLW